MLSVLLVVAAEVCVCLLLFLPQSRMARRLKSHSEYVEDQLGRLQQTPETFHKLVAQVNETREIVSGLNLFTGRSVQAIVVNAVGRAAGPESVAVLSLAPETAPKKQVPGASAKYWRLRCKGSFGELTLFLSSIERQGVMLDAGEFRLDATAKGELELEVLLKIWKPASLSEASSEPEARPEGQ